MAELEPDWTTLPIEIIEQIAGRSKFSEDLFACSVVCKSWLSMPLIGKLSQTLPPRCPKYPLVMLTDIAEKNYPIVTEDFPPDEMLVQEVKKNECIEGMNKRRFFSLSTSKTFEFELPEATRKKCFGVSNGWLLTIGFDFQINLLNPFTRQQISMPNMLSFKTRYKIEEIDDDEDEDEYDFDKKLLVYMIVDKAVMSSHPHREDCIILAIYGEVRILAFARPGDEVWTDINIDPFRGIYEDVVYYNGKFYAVNNHGIVYLCDINNANGPKAIPLTCMLDGDNYMNRRYLVESSGFLLLLVRSFRLEMSKDTTYYFTTGFRIFKLEECETSSNYPFRATPMNSLGNQALFIGSNASVSVPSSKCVKANCIYFSEDKPEYYYDRPYGGGRDTGIFEVETGNITLHYASEFASHLTPPMWFV